MKTKIIGQLKSSNIVNLKNLYCEGLTLILDCPKCMKKISESLDSIHPCQVQPNGKAILNFGCPHCAEALSIPINIKVSITL